MIAAFAISETQSSVTRSACHCELAECGNLPAKNDQGRDQQPEKQRHQQGRNKPLSKIEFLGVEHKTAFSG
ncbi:hypothetical protein [Bradyrhizobium sp.]|jgi:hypothetical protein|uniref:hypothetical protein n=1 Tax=Bradyrhizobium sp. TaxID=376 RepID=UPI003C179B27